MMAKDGKLQVLLWSELTEPKDIYPNGITGVIADHLNGYDNIDATTATLTDPEQGVSEAALENADVLFWFGHTKPMPRSSTCRLIRATDSSVTSPCFV